MTNQFDIRQAIWDQLNELHMLADDIANPQQRYGMVHLLHEVHDNIDKLITAVRTETINVQPKTTAKYTVATGSAISYENKLWFSVVSCHSTGCYYFGPFSKEEYADQVTEKLTTVLEVINSVINT